MKSVSLPPEEKAGVEAAPGISRRAWLDKAGAGAVAAALGAQVYVLARSLGPNVLYEAPKRFKAGLPEQFPEGATFLEDKRVYIFRQQRAFYAISAVCTHLGCTVKLVNLAARHEFQCPCHGSKYRGDGSNYAGPAPRPLAWHRLEISPDDGQLVVHLDELVDRGFRLTV